MKIRRPLGRTLVRPPRGEDALPGLPWLEPEYDTLERYRSRRKLLVVGDDKRLARLFSTIEADRRRGAVGEDDHCQHERRADEHHERNEELDLPSSYPPL